MGVKARSSAWLQLLLKPAKWKQEHRGHVQRKDFASPRLIFCYLGKAASFLSRAFFQAVMMRRENKAQPTATQSQLQDCRRSPDFCTHIHSLLQGSGFSGAEPLSHLPFHRVGSMAEQCLLPWTATIKCLQSGNFQLPRAEVGVPWGSSPPALGWLMSFEGLEKALEKMGQ